MNGMQFDLDQIETKTRAEEGVRMVVRNTAGLPLKNRLGDEVALILCGTDSAAYQSATRDVATQKVERAQKEAEKTGVVANTPVFSNDDDTIEVLTRCTKGWEGMLAKGTDTPVPFSQEAARTLYREFPFLREQADNFIARRSNFILAR